MSKPLPEGCRMVDYSIPSDVRYQALTGHNVIRDPKLPQPPLTPEKEAKRLKRLGAMHTSAAPLRVVVVKPKYR